MKRIKNDSYVGPYGFFPKKTLSRHWTRLTPQSHSLNPITRRYSYNTLAKFYHAFRASSRETVPPFRYMLSPKPLMPPWLAADVWLLPKDNPHRDRISYLMLALSASGILDQIVMNEARFENLPNPHKWTAIVEAEMKLYPKHFVNSLIMLAVCLFVASSTFLWEKFGFFNDISLFRAMKLRSWKFESITSKRMKNSTLCFLNVMSLISCCGLLPFYVTQIRRNGESLTLMIWKENPRWKYDDTFHVYRVNSENGDTFECQMFIWNSVGPESAIKRKIPDRLRSRMALIDKETRDGHRGDGEGNPLSEL